VEKTVAEQKAAAESINSSEAMAAHVNILEMSGDNYRLSQSKAKQN
jgi:hypothetical protein